MFTKKEINKIFDLLTDYSQDKKEELISKYWSFSDKDKLEWLNMCISTKMCNTSTVYKVNKLLNK